MTTLPAAALRARIGETAVYTAPEPVGTAASRYFALAIGERNPLYTGVVDGVGPIVAPTLLFETNQYADVATDEFGYAGHSWHLETDGARLVRGGHRYRWHRDVRPGDVVTATWTLADVAERTTRTGAAMLVVTSECRFTDAAGEPICEQTEDLILVALS